MASTHNIVLNTITRERLTFGVLIFFRVSTRSNKILCALSLNVTTSFSPLSLSLLHTHSLSQTLSLPFSTFLPSIFPRLNVSPGHRVASFCQDFFQANNQLFEYREFLQQQLLQQQLLQQQLLQQLRLGLKFYLTAS